MQKQQSRNNKLPLGGDGHAEKRIAELERQLAAATDALASACDFLEEAPCEYVPKGETCGHCEALAKSKAVLAASQPRPTRRKSPHPLSGGERVEAIQSLHRYMTWACYLRIYHVQALKSCAEDTQESNAHKVQAFSLQSLWYATLFTVIEGWKTLGLSDPDVDPLLASPNVELLRRYRNYVAHYQRRYYDGRAIEFMSAPGTVSWVVALDNALLKAFRRIAQEDGLMKPDTVDT